MGNQSSASRVLLKEITADDDDKSITAEIVELMWNTYNVCSLEHNPKFARIEPIYKQLFEPLFDLFMEQKRATLLVFFANEDGMEYNIGFIKQKEIKIMPILDSNGNIKNLFKILHDKAPGYKRYIMIRLYREP